MIAIIGMLAGVASASINQIFSNQTRKFINECDAMLTRCRVETLSGAPSNTFVEFRLDDSDSKYYVAYYKGNVLVEEERLKTNSVSCTYCIAGGAPVPFDDDGESLRISYSRTTGAMDEHGTQ